MAQVTGIVRTYADSPEKAISNAEIFIHNYIEYPDYRDVLGCWDLNRNYKVKQGCDRPFDNFYAAFVDEVFKKHQKAESIALVKQVYEEYSKGILKRGIDIWNAKNLLLEYDEIKSLQYAITKYHGGEIARKYLQSKNLTIKELEKLMCQSLFYSNDFIFFEEQIWKEFSISNDSNSHPDDGYMYLVLISTHV